MNDITRPLDIFEQFNRAFPDWFGRELSGPAAGAGRLLPAVDIRQEEGKFVIEVDVPGYKPEEVNVSVEDRVLTIQGERSSESKEEKEGYIRTERQRGKMFRQFTLPGAVQADDITAKVADGVLTIQVPQVEAKQPKQIPIS
jgi:HSP20 family protein